jgi:hypothetical protein
MRLRVSGKSRAAFEIYSQITFLDFSQAFGHRFPAPQLAVRETK